MPSSKKTPNLLLNKWLGSDKPKKDDFVEDNEIIDRSFGDITGRMDGLAEAQQALREEIGEDLSATLGGIGSRIDQVAQSVEAVGTQAGTISGNLTAHIGNTVPHITAQERSGWNNLKPVVGSYRGGGTISQKITLGFKPSYGMVYAVDRPLINLSWDYQYNQMYSAILSSSGCSKGVAVENDGFTVYSMGPDSQRYHYDLNNNEITYAYIMWR